MIPDATRATVSAAARPRGAAAWALAALVAATPPTPASAQQAERPDVQVGDRWDFAVYYASPSTTPSRVWLVTAVTPAGIAGTENGEPLTLTREVNVVESPRTRQSNGQLLAFPLAVGKRWRFDNDWLYKPKGSQGKAAGEVVVEAWERVTVPAGAFDAFRLTSREALSGTSPVGSRYDGHATRTYWYAPAARAIVKMVSHNPYLGGSTDELVALALRP